MMGTDFSSRICREKW